MEKTVFILHLMSGCHLTMNDFNGRDGRDYLVQLFGQNLQDCQKPCTRRGQKILDCMRLL